MKKHSHEHMPAASEHKKHLAEDHWFRIASRLYEHTGEVPDPLQIRAAAIIDALGIPSGEVSALETNERGERQNPEKDRIIAEYLTNKPGVVIDEAGDIVSSDFRDIYPEGLPEELAQALDPDTRAIMEAEYAHIRHIQEEFGDTESKYESDVPTHYVRLPGGIDLFLRGYMHDVRWQKNHGAYLQKANRHARIIGIEGFSDAPFGDSLDIHWGDTALPGDGDYDTLMHEAVAIGFNGLFAEIDARDESKIIMDGTGFLKFPKLPDSFFQKYFAYLENQHPALARLIGTPDDLKKTLQKQSTTEGGIRQDIKIIPKDGKVYRAHPYTTQDGSTSFEPTFLELGQKLFADALAAVKLHLMGKLMADGHIPKGPIVDYEGAAHLSSKSFFLKYPGYAMEVVLRTVNELMAGREEDQSPIKKIKNLFLGKDPSRISEERFGAVYRAFEHTPWHEVVEEIVRLPLKKIEDDASKPVEPGPNQRKLLDVPLSVLDIYGLNPQEMVPTDEEVHAIQEKLKSRARPHSRHMAA